MTHKTDNENEYSSNLDVLTAAVDDKWTIDGGKYVAQLEKRVLEQEYLIALLREKISGLESTKVPLYAGVVRAGTSSGGINASDSVRSSSNGSKPHVDKSGDIGSPIIPGNDGLRRRYRSDECESLVGSRKTDIASVAAVKLFQVFVSRIDPSTCAKKLAQDLLSNVPELSAVRCSKMKTKHPSYTSFHVAVPESQRPLLWKVEAWPEGSYIRQFGGKLLKSHVLEVYDSEAPVVPKSSENSTADDSSKSKVLPVKPPSGVKNTASGKTTRAVTAVGSGSGVNPKSPAASGYSPKNTRNRGLTKNQ